MLKAKKVLKQLSKDGRMYSKYLHMAPRRLIEYFSTYEVDFKRLTGVDFEDWYYRNEEPTKPVTADIIEGEIGNSYNWDSSIIFDWQGITIDKAEYIAIKFHISGDVRANYTDSIIVPRCAVEPLHEIIMNLTKVAYGYKFAGSHYEFVTDATRTKDCYTIYKNYKPISDCLFIDDIDSTVTNKRELDRQLKKSLKTGCLSNII